MAQTPDRRLKLHLVALPDLRLAAFRYVRLTQRNDGCKIPERSPSRQMNQALGQSFLSFLLEMAIFL